MNYFKINGKSYDVLVTSLVESFNILYRDNSGRTLAEGAPMFLDAIGTFFGHKVVVNRKKGFEDSFDELYEFLAQPRNVVDPETDGIDVEIAHNQTTISYKAYVSNGERALQRIDEKSQKIYWGELSIKIIPIEAQIKPARG